MKIQFTNCERNYWRILNIIIIFQCLRENKQANKEMAYNKALKVSNVIKFSYSCFLEKKKCFFVFILINNKKKNISWHIFNILHWKQIQTIALHIFHYPALWAFELYWFNFTIARLGMVCWITEARSLFLNTVF